MLLAGKNVDAAARQALPNADELRAAQPEDLVLISVSSHGYTDESGRFYIIPFDVGNSPEGDSVEKVKDRAISSDELSSWVRDVDAGELVMIIDACHSAAAVAAADFKPGPMDSRGLGQMAYDKGMRILAATQADDVALESRQIRQGLLTYALLHDGLEETRAAGPEDDGRVTLSRWLRYGAARVPSLYREMTAAAPAQTGAGDADTGRAVMVFASGHHPPARRDLQQPVLFDFNRDLEDPLIASAAQTPPGPASPLPAPLPSGAETGPGPASGDLSATPGPGEIAVEGVVISVPTPGKSFKLFVASVILPSGQTIALHPPKTKTVNLLNSADPASTALISTLKIGTRLVATGRDGGAGTPLAARILAAR